MSTKVKITTVGNSAGIVLPKEILKRLNVDKGDSVTLTETAQGFFLSAYDETFMRKMQHEYGIYFSYQADSIKSTIVVTAEPNKKREPDAERFLSSVLTPAGLTYEKVNNVYVITSLAIKQALKATTLFIDVSSSFCRRIIFKRSKN